MAWDHPSKAKLDDGVRLLRLLQSIESAKDRATLIALAERLAEKNRLWQEILQLWQEALKKPDE